MSGTVNSTVINMPEKETNGRSHDHAQSTSSIAEQGLYTEDLQPLSTQSNLNSSILPLYYVSKVLGLTCFTVSTENGQVYYRYSPQGIIYTILIFSVALAAFTYTNVYMYCTNEYTILDYSYLMVINEEFKIGAPLLLTFTSLLSALKQKETLACLLNLEGIDEILGRFNINIPYQRNKCVLIILLVTGNALITLLVLSDTVLTSTSKTKIDVFCWISYVLPKFLNYVSECQFLGWTWSLRQRHRLLNGRLESGHHDATLVPALSAAHASLGAIAEDVNNLFALQLLVRISFYFVDILANSFFGIQTVPHLVERDFLPSYFVVYSFYWTVSVTSELIIICAACSSLKKEARRTGVVVHAVQRKCTNPRVNEQLQMFSSQLLHQRVGFTACGLFAVDLRLVHAVFGTVATFLVILVQYDSRLVQLALNEGNKTVTKQ